MRYPLLDFGGRGRPLHFTPATGFPPATYRPLFDRLAAGFHCISMPPRALWTDIGPPPPVPGSWEQHAEDIEAGLAQHGLADVVLVGHSFGGVASLVTAVRHRSRYQGLVLLDPTLLREDLHRRFVAAKAKGWAPPDEHPLAGRARVRRSDFATKEEAFESWRGRSLFSLWSNEALRAYVDAGLTEGPGGYTLVWTGPWEAHSFESIYLGSWDEVPRLDPALPVLLLYGDVSDTFGPAQAARFHQLAPHATVAAIPGGHLFPQESPAETAAAILDWAGRALR